MLLQGCSDLVVYIARFVMDKTSLKDLGREGCLK